MKLTTRSEYALLALIYLARQADGSYTTVETIAQAQSIPPKYLEQILLALKRARYLRSAKGQGGGYGLAQAADQIALADVVRLFDGALAPTESVSEYFYEPTPLEKEQSLIRVFREIRDFVADKLEHTTIADVC
jgi:Rrf2 family transcriptional regulator, cysteine metabolism repressor